MSRGGTRKIDSSSLVLLVVVAIAAASAVLGFRAVLTDWSFAVGAVAGSVGGTIVMGLSWRTRLLAGETVAASILAALLCGAVLIGPVPTPSAFRTVLDAVVSGWAELLSVTPPTDLTDTIAVLPFVLAWSGATVGAVLAQRTATPALPILGPLVAFAVTVLVTDENRDVALAQGALLSVAAIVLALVQWRRMSSESLDPVAEIVGAADDQISSDGAAAGGDPERARRGTWMPLLRAGTVLVVIAIAAPAVGPQLPFADSNERFDLRDRTDPPWDPLLIGSPLADVKASLRSDRAEQRVFTVRSAASPTRFTLAVLGDYDGATWTVGSTTGVSPVEEFRPVGEELPARDARVALDAREADAGGGAATEIEIEIDALSGPFVPIVGIPTRLRVEQPEGVTLPEPDKPAGTRMNLRTGTIATPQGLVPGEIISMSTTITTDPTDELLRDRRLGPVPPVGEREIVPLSLRNLIADTVEGVEVGWPQVEALRNRFVENGFYDTSPLARPGHALFRLDEFLADGDQLVGFEEQYAASAALLGRLAQIPTRVAVGYRVPEERYVDGIAEVFAPDISAWIEVDVEGLGWIPVDVSPDRSRAPTSEAEGTRVEDVAIPSPPPPPPIPPTPDLLASEDEIDDPDEEDDAEEEDESQASTGALSPLAVAAGVAGATAGTLFLLLAGIALFKVRRRRRRRAAVDPASGVAGAWRELLDRMSEIGVDVSQHATPPEVARLLEHEVLPGQDLPELRSMVDTVQRSAFHADPPAPAVAQDAWRYHDTVVEGVYRSASTTRRIVMRVDPRTIRRRR